LTGALNSNLTPTAIAVSNSAFDLAATEQANSATLHQSRSVLRKTVCPAVSATFNAATVTDDLGNVTNLVI
jgi:hypothetical protein